MTIKWTDRTAVFRHAGRRFSGPRYVSEDQRYTIWLCRSGRWALEMEGGDSYELIGSYGSANDAKAAAEAVTRRISKS